MSHEDLGRANSAYVREAARSFIRGAAGDVSSGWGSRPGHVSALLCFDEVQVRGLRRGVGGVLVDTACGGGCMRGATHSLLFSPVIQACVNCAVSSSEEPVLPGGRQQPHETTAICLRPCR